MEPAPESVAAEEDASGRRRTEGLGVGKGPHGRRLAGVHYHSTKDAKAREAGGFRVVCGV